MIQFEYLDGVHVLPETKKNNGSETYFFHPKKRAGQCARHVCAYVGGLTTQTLTRKLALPGWAD